MARRRGQYANTADATALDRLENTLKDSDPSHYFGAVPKIHLEKFTNGDNADRAPGPQLTAGDTVNWKYVVTNTGNVSLQSLKVTDDKIGAIDCPRDSLAVGASVTCRATGTAEEGQYENTGSADAQFVPPDTNDPASGPGVMADPVSVHDADPSHYFALAEGGGNEPGGPGGGNGNEPGGVNGNEPGGLPGTGADLSALSWAFGLLLAGALCLAMSRRRRLD